MKKQNTQILRTTIAALLLSSIFITANAQKLPNVQTISLRAPATIKVDGKTTEWDNKFQAYNHATEVYYTLSNDDNYLYLTVQATDQSVINKIMSGGITLAINKARKKNDKNGVSITYPVFDRKNKPFFGTKNKLEIERGITTVTDNPDSVMTVHNRILGEKSKLIGVTGIPGMDTLISVYNTDGIKTAQLFNNKGAYTYELAVSLKNLGLTVDNPDKFAYHITLNGSSLFNNISFKASGMSEGGGGSAPISVGAISFTSADGSDAVKLFLDGGTAAPTDFWGEYTLAKQPGRVYILRIK